MWKKIFAFLIACSLESALASAATIVVDLNGGANYTDIQSAIDAAADGDTVLVKPGEYVITRPINFKGKAITVKSEGGAEVTTVRMSETPANPDRASVVVFENGEAGTAVFEGFTIIGGKETKYETEVYEQFGGGGVLCINSSCPTFTNCTISGNSVDGNGGGVACYDGSSPTMKNCTIAGNSASGAGGGVDCMYDSSPTLSNCTISGNSAVAGGGVACYDGSSPTVTNCTIWGNWAEQGGAVFSLGLFASYPTLVNSIVWGNTGGDLDSVLPSGTVVSFSCVETEEVWPGEGNSNSDPLFCGFMGPRDVYVDAASAFEGDGSQGSPFRDLARGLEYRLSLRADSPCIGTGKDGVNMGADEGTCDSAGQGDRVVHLAAGRYTGGITLAHGASILGDGAEGTVVEGTVWGLKTGARLSGVTVTGGRNGGIVIAGGESPTIEDCTISGNSADRGLSSGGGVYCSDDSSPTLTNCTITGNRATEWGGGLVCLNSSPTLTNCTISGNRVSHDYGGSGGGVACMFNSSPTFANCSISGNLALWSGGGVECVDGSPTFRNCTISGNWSWDGFGGGVYCAGSSPTLTNCTITGNSASGFQGGEGLGGGVYCRVWSSPTLTNCTISGNSAFSAGGGVYCVEDSSPTLTNCIVWGNTPDSVCGGLSFCLTDQDPLFVRPGKWVDCVSPDDPECLAYQWDPNTGEETAWHRWEFDYHFQPGSPAIDAGTSEGAPTTDIEGNVRPCGERVDIGAYEFGDCGPPRSFKRGDSNADGTLDISDPVATLGFLFLGTKAPDCLDAADSNDSGVVDLSDAVYSLQFLFIGGPAPESPFPGCGVDPVIDELTCEAFRACQ